MKSYKLFKRTRVLLSQSRPSGFARFVKGCDTGKYGKKRRKPRTPKIHGDDHVELREIINRDIPF